jgi:hypothetical protein
MVAYGKRFLRHCDVVGVVEEEGVAPSHFRGTVLLGRHDDQSAFQLPCHVVDDLSRVMRETIGNIDQRVRVACDSTPIEPSTVRIALLDLVRDYWPEGGSTNKCKVH